MNRLLSFALIVILITNASYAFANSDILDSIAENYQQGSIIWFEPLFKIAQQLFTILATIEVAWTAVIWALEKDEFKSLTASLIKKIMSIGFFYALLINSNVWIPSIIDSFISAGHSASGLKEVGFSPSQVLDTGLKITWIMVKELQVSGIVDTITTGITVMIASLIIIFAFAVIASQLLIALIESYIVISGGVIFLGFGGSRWTTDFTQRYISYAFAIGVKLFVMYLLIGIGQNQVVGWPESLNPVNIKSVLTVMGSSLVYMFLVWQIPSMASSILSGTPNITAGSAASTIASSGAMMIGAGAHIGATGLSGAKSATGFANAASAAWNTAQFESFTKAASSSGETTSMSSKVGQFGSAFKHFVSASMEDGNFSTGSGTPKTKGERMSSILNERTGKFKENIAANTPFTPSSSEASAGNNHRIENNMATASTSVTEGSNRVGNNITSHHSDLSNNPPAGNLVSPKGDNGTLLQANEMNQIKQEQNKNMIKNMPKSLEENLRNIAHNRGRPQIPQDSSPNTTINIRLNHTEN